MTDAVDITKGVEVSATLTMDLPPETYNELIGSVNIAAHYQFTAEYSLDPYLRWVDLHQKGGWRRLLRQIKDIFVYEYKKASGRAVGEKITVNIPNLQFKGASNTCLTFSAPTS